MDLLIITDYVLLVVEGQTNGKTCKHTIVITLTDRTQFIHLKAKATSIRQTIRSQSQGKDLKAISQLIRLRVVGYGCDVTRYKNHLCIIIAVYC